MKLQHRAFLALSFALILPGVSAQAGALNTQRVAANAEWVAHVNVEAIAASKLFKSALENAGAMHMNLDGMDEMKEHLGIDPLKDLKDATIYGAGDPEDGNMVIVANANGNVDQAVAKLKEQMPIVELTVAGQTILKIDQDGDETFFQVRPGKSSDDRVVIVARSQENISKAIDVLDGKAANLASAADSPLAKAATPGAGSMLFAAAKGLPWMVNDEDGDENDPASQILRTSDRLSLDLGEDGPNSYVNLLVGTGSEDDAKNIGDVLNGFMAMGRLAIGNQPELADAKALMSSVKLATAGKDVRVEMRHNTDDLIKIGQKLSALAAENDEDHDTDHEDKDDDHHHNDSKTDAGADDTHPAPN